MAWLPDARRVALGFCVSGEGRLLWRNMAPKLTKLSLQKAMGADIAKGVSAFRAFKTETREAFVNLAPQVVTMLPELGKETRPR